MKLQILTPEKKLFEGEASVITFPGADGLFQVMNNHAPLVATLGNGKIVVKGKGGGQQEFATNGGFVEVLNNDVAALVESVATE